MVARGLSTHLSLVRVRAGALYRYTVVPRALRALGPERGYREGRRLGRRRFATLRALVQPQVAEMAARLGVSHEQAEAWLERAFELGALEELDAVRFDEMQRHGPQQVIEVRGRERLDEALASGKGAILCAAHFFGDFPFFVALALQGYRPNVVGLPQTIGRERGDQWHPERRHAAMEGLGVGFLRMTPGAFGIAVQARNALRRNEVVAILIDHHVAEQTVQVPFLGSPGTFPLGPAMIAQASGAPLLPFAIRRLGPDRPQVAEIGEPMLVGDDLEAGMRHCVEALERAVRADPPTWSPWIYRRKLVWAGAAREAGEDPPDVG